MLLVCLSYFPALCDRVAPHLLVIDVENGQRWYHVRRAAMEKLVDEGMAASIGVSNFSERALRELMAAARIKPVVNQIELHPLLSQRRLVGACLRMVSFASAIDELSTLSIVLSSVPRC